MVNKKNICAKCGEADPANFYSSSAIKCKKCQKEKKANHYHNDPEYRKKKIEQVRVNQKNKIYYYRHLAAKHRALRKKMEFNITPEYLETLHERQNYKCRYSKLDITNQFAIDRIDSSKGYVIGNIALTANAVNNIKSNMTLDQFIYVIKKLYENLVPKIPSEKLDKLEIKFNNEIIWATV